jgi:hypothetical protein
MPNVRIGVALAMLGAVSVSPAQVRPGRTSTATVSTAGCPPHVYYFWRNHQFGSSTPTKPGKIACASDPSRPAILLVHGLHQDASTWTAPSYVEHAYDRKANVGEQRIGDTHDKPNSGLYKIGASPWLYGNDRVGWDKNVNWFDYLAAQGFTVATWSQPDLTFAPASQSALVAFDSLVAHTRARSPNAAPPIVLIGHSRGGLVIRKLLKDRGSAGRIETVVTLHSPHRGSELGRTPGRVVAEVVDLVDCCLPSNMTGPVKTRVKEAVVEMMRPFTKLVWPDENRELIPDGPLMRMLADGEKAVPGVRYFTFGGTEPGYYRMYAWYFDVMSANPQYSGTTQYFVWRVKPVEIGPLSPIMDALRDFVDEVKPGRGDGLVTDVSARLPWSTHNTTSLNHAEVLWNRPLQQQVVSLINGGRRMR